MARSFDPGAIPAYAKCYWKRPPNQNQGSKTESVVHEAVGKALSEWERLEQEVAAMFLALVGVPQASSDPTRRAFGKVESSGTRRSMILAAAQAYFGQHWEDKDVRLSFGRALEAVSWASSRRDDIAHGIAQRHVLDGTDFGWFLFPANYNTERTKPWVAVDDTDPLYFTFTNFRYTAEDIQLFAARFIELGQAIFSQAALIHRYDDDTIAFVRAVKDDPILKI